MSTHRTINSRRALLTGAIFIALLAASISAPAALATSAEFEADSKGAVSSLAVFEAAGEGDVKVEATASTLQVFEVDVGAVECESFSGKGTSANSTREIELGDLSYGDCFAFGLEAGVDPNGCEYVLEAGANEGSATSGSMAIACPQGQQIEIDASGLCTVRVPPQSGLGVAYATAGTNPQSVTGSIEANNISYSYEGECGKGWNANGVQFGEISLSAVSDDEAEAAVGLSVARKPIENPEVRAAGNGLFSMEFGEFECAKMTASGLSEAEQSVTQSLTSVEYSECAFFGLQAEVDFNGCAYEFNAGTLVKAGQSVGTMDIICPGSQEIEISSPGMCNVEIPAQQGLGSVTYTNEATNEDIVADFDLDYISYSYEGSSCGTGYPDDGSYSGKAVLSAVSDDEAEDPVALSIVG